MAFHAPCGTRFRLARGSSPGRWGAAAGRSVVRRWWGLGHAVSLRPGRASTCGARQAKQKIPWAEGVERSCGRASGQGRFVSRAVDGGCQALAAGAAFGLPFAGPSDCRWGRVAPRSVSLEGMEGRRWLSTGRRRWRGAAAGGCICGLGFALAELAWSVGGELGLGELRPAFCAAPCVERHATASRRFAGGGLEAGGYRFAAAGGRLGGHIGLAGVVGGRVWARYWPRNR